MSGPVQMGDGIDIPNLAGDSGHELLGSAIEILKKSESDGAEKSNLFKKFADQIKNKTNGSWSASYGKGTDGAHFFFGEQGEVLIIDKAGKLYRSKIQHLKLKDSETFIFDPTNLIPMK